ncbi:MAG: hypothetical protein U0325_08885 [Polyangiales bacterium]
MKRAAIPLIVTLLQGAPALAQCDAGPSDDEVGVLRDTFPADLGTEVPTDGLVRLRYQVRPPEPTTLCVRRRDAQGCLAGTASVLRDEVVWQAAAPLDAITDYVATFADTVGGSNLIRFRTGSGPSSAPPRFSGLSSAVIAGDAEDPCDPDAVDITVRFDRAQRTSGVAWPDSDIEYVLFVTRGEGVSGPRVLERARIQGSGFSGDRAAQRTVRVPGVLARGPMCLVMRATDPSGRTDGNSVEHCVNPSLGNHFRGCATAPTSAGTPWGLFAVAAAISVRRRFSRRRGV